ncbi:tRNA threonylcarbamoyladenosine biosynthesis protein TsaE [Acaryochloris thomasi RCC1774]|uniref:tRNA threonylcarbamoyladenosine biosynthesis protein TsaE n=1 Tax=Acaryochloris thomasi RCC1774 TaxID=1764569 RepID=A0A2W1JQ07_9CYAN|nr:tRNA (adenosine(37)-N6)-threonylcarbamoyltransferase complex ATPase subunit type 1 TsaE [Acaryochloris thomasi]PZD75389.1 tRNA threonylcarbamoyladenosine biosynthesis protein TsaE [Acaryochloris thomasi RCC1774]
MLTLSLPDSAATQALGLKLGQSLPTGSILLLDGDLGSGKTSLVQSIGQGLGITDMIVSPTFTLINEYHTGRLPLYHLDLYRLPPAEVSNLYLDTYWEGIDFPLGIVAIEWPERLSDWPESYIHVKLQYQGEGRQATLTTQGSAQIEEMFVGWTS